MYGQEKLHPSQQLSEPPLIKRNLVRNIVAQFNKEAKKRDKMQTVMSSEDLHYNSMVPVYTDANGDDTGPNNNIPFSYTSTVPFAHQKSKSEYDLKSPNEVIYAQVVVDGQGANGKKTVHTKVPVYNGESTKYSKLTNGMSRNQSVSMGNLQSNYCHHSPYDKVDIGAHEVNDYPIRTRNYEYIRNERSRSESPYTDESHVRHRVNGISRHPKVTRKEMTEEKLVTGKETTTEKMDKRDKGRKERIRSRSEESRFTNKIIPREPYPDYNQNEAWDKIEYQDVSEDFQQQVKEIPTIERKFRRRLVDNVEEPIPDYDHGENKEGYEEVDQSVWQNQFVTNGTTSNKEGQILIGKNGIKKEIIKGNTSNKRTTEHVTTEKTVTRRHRSSSGGRSKEEKEEQRREKEERRREKEERRREKEERKKEKEKQKELERMSKLSKKKEQKQMKVREALQAQSTQNGDDKRFYYFGANEEIVRPPRKKEKEKLVTSDVVVTGLSSTKLVKEANAQVSGQEKYTSKWKTDLRHVSSSPTGSANQDSGYFSRGGISPISLKDKHESPEPVRERIIHVDVEGRKKSRYQRTSEEHITGGFSHDAEERMETSESDDINPHWVPGGSRDSQVSAPSNQWSSLEEDDEEIVAAHINTPQSMVREMGKREISYENSQRPPEKDAELLWSDKAHIDTTDYRREMSTGCFNAGTDVRNDNHVNNNWPQSATLSRLETNRNRINNDTTMKTSTVDRRQWQKGSSERNANSSAVKLLLNGREMIDSDTSAHRAGILNKSSNYASETESQTSNRSKGSRKSNGSSPALKRVNFKTRSKAKRSASSAANLSPIHREAMLRAGSPIRPASANESLHSSGSDASQVILHAATVADIPPPVSYRYRIYKESSLSGSPTPPSSRKGKAVTRTFSLLAPWKPKKYKQKNNRSYENQSDGSIRTSTPDKEASSRNHSTEHLDSLSPLPSETTTGKKKSKKVVRTNSVPKDTRFTGFFKRKKEKA